MRREVPPSVARAPSVWRKPAQTVLWLVVLVLWVTGVVLNQIPADLLAEADESIAGLRRSALVVHGITAWVTLALIGRWVWPHVAANLHMRMRPTGWINAGAGIALLSAGLALLYAPAGWRPAALAVHWWMGLLWPGALAVHTLLTRWWLQRQPTSPTK